jgi:predicted nucleotidyltransferase
VPRIATTCPLQRYEAALKARGGRHAAVFGSHARGDARPDGDTDVMDEIDLAAVFDYARLKGYIAASLMARPT